MWENYSKQAACRRRRVWTVRADASYSEMKLNVNAILQAFAKHGFNLKIDRKTQVIWKIYWSCPESLLCFVQLREPSAACFGHNDEDYEEEAHSPDGCHGQHHRCQNAWNRGKNNMKNR